MEVLTAKVVTLAYNNGADQAREASSHVHDIATGEIQHLALVEKPVGSPHRMAQRTIDHQVPCCHEDKHRAELEAVSEGTTNERRRDDGEGGLSRHCSPHGASNRG